VSKEVHGLVSSHGLFHTELEVIFIVDVDHVLVLLVLDSIWSVMDAVLGGESCDSLLELLECDWSFDSLDWSVSLIT